MEVGDSQKFLFFLEQVLIIDRFQEREERRVGEREEKEEEKEEEREEELEEEEVEEKEVVFGKVYDKLVMIQEISLCIYFWV